MNAFKHFPSWVIEIKQHPCAAYSSIVLSGGDVCCIFQDRLKKESKIEQGHICWLQVIERERELVAVTTYCKGMVKLTRWSPSAHWQSNYPNWRRSWCLGRSLFWTYLLSPMRLFFLVAFWTFYFCAFYNSLTVLSPIRLSAIAL